MMLGMSYVLFALVLLHNAIFMVHSDNGWFLFAEISSTTSMKRMFAVKLSQKYKHIYRLWYFREHEGKSQFISERWGCDFCCDIYWKINVSCVCSIKKSCDGNYHFNDRFSNEKKVFCLATDKYAVVEVYLFLSSCHRCLCAEL